MTKRPKAPPPEATEEDPFDALFTGKLVPPVVMDDTDDPDRRKT